MQGKDIGKYTQEQREAHLKVIEKLIMAKWELFVGNWLQLPEGSPIITEMVTAFNHRCVFMNYVANEETGKVQALLGQVFVLIYTTYIAPEQPGTQENNRGAGVPGGYVQPICDATGGRDHECGAKFGAAQPLPREKSQPGARHEH